MLVAGELCKKIEATALSSLPEDPGWASLQCDVTAGTMTDFGERAAQVLGSILARALVFMPPQQRTARISYNLVTVLFKFSRSIVTVHLAAGAAGVEPS